MTHIQSRRRAAWLPPLPRVRPECPPRPWRWRALLALAVCVILCHGCHGEDVDDEAGVFLRPRRAQEHAAPALVPSDAGAVAE
jgi:hypothetical protein